MSNAVRIGPVGAFFPDELWRCVFEQAPTLDDALRWADAFQRPIAPSDYRALLQIAAPDLLHVLPRPTARALLGHRPHAACAVNLLIDYSPLVGPLYDDSAGAIANPKDFSHLFSATSAMTAFAPHSAVTYDLLQLSHDAWSVCFASETVDESAYRSRCSSTVLFDAFRDEATSATLWLGDSAKLPPYFAGLPALQILHLLDMTAPLDLRPLKGLTGLTDITLGADTPLAASTWFRKAMARVAPSVRITQLTQAVPSPPMPLRLGSEAWFDARRTHLFAMPPDAATSLQDTRVMTSEAPHAEDNRRVSLTVLQNMLGDIDSIHAGSRDKALNAFAQET